MLHQEELFKHQENHKPSKPSSIALIPLLSLLCIVYFIYHLIQGDRGIRSYLKLNTRIENAQKDLDFLTARKTKLEERIRLLSPQHMDPELLDERVRAMLGFAKKSEKIIYLEKPKPKGDDYKVILVPENH